MSVAESLRTDLEAADYLNNPLPFSELVKHYESWMREALILPYSYDGEISNNRFESYGQLLVEMGERAVAERVGKPGYTRQKAELRGLENLEKLLVEQAEVGDVIILLSPPGSSEDGFGANGQRRLSFSYVFFVLGDLSNGKKTVRAVAIPTKEITPDKHEHIFREVFGQYNSICINSNNSFESQDQKLVANPILLKIPDQELIEKLDMFGLRFAGKNWRQINLEVGNGLKLSKDKLAEQRRESLIQTIAWQTRRYIDEKDREKLENIGEAARVILAREVGGHYLGWSSKKMLEEYRKTESSMWLQRQIRKADSWQRARLVVQHGAEIMVARLHLMGLQRAIVEDANVTEILMGSSCGGGGYDEIFNSLNGRTGDMSKRNNLIQSIFEKAKSESESSSSSESMKCVECPFCHKTVDAIVTSSKIKCPECKTEVSKGGD